MIARTRTSVVCLQNDKLLAFRAIDPHSQKEYVFLPGGAIESDETAPEAAERETLEETGYKVVVSPNLNVDREYNFDWAGQTYSTLTLFYRAYLYPPVQSPKKVQDASYNLGAIWIPKEQIKETFSYSEPIQSAILELIEDESLSEV